MTNWEKQEALSYYLGWMAIQIPTEWWSHTVATVVSCHVKRPATCNTLTAVSDQKKITRFISKLKQGKVNQLLLMSNESIEYNYLCGRCGTQKIQPFKVWVVRHIHKGQKTISHGCGSKLGIGCSSSFKGSKPGQLAWLLQFMLSKNQRVRSDLGKHFKDKIVTVRGVHAIFVFHCDNIVEVRLHSTLSFQMKEAEQTAYEDHRLDNLSSCLP